METAKKFYPSNKNQKGYIPFIPKNEKELVNPEDNLYELKMDTENESYGFVDTLQELFADIALEYDENEIIKVKNWVQNSKIDDEYVSDDGQMHIWKIGK